MVFYRKLRKKLGLKAGPYTHLAQNVHKQLKGLFIYLILIFILHSVAMMLLEGLDPGNAIWLTFTTITTVGYGDIVAKTPWGQAATITLLYIGGIFVLAQFAGLYFEARADRRRQIIFGHWRWTMENHILILNTPKQNPEIFLKNIIEPIQNLSQFEHMDIHIVSEHFEDGLPNKLQKLGVGHYDGRPDERDILAKAHPESAYAIIILAEEETNPISDAITFDLLHRLQEFKIQGRILVECVDQENRERLKNAGANIVIRPLRTYPEILVRALDAPGTEKIAEDMFSSLSPKECLRFDIEITRKWGNIIQDLINKDLGLPLGYLNKENKVVVAPNANEMVTTKAIYILSENKYNLTLETIKQSLT